MPHPSARKHSGTVLFMHGLGDTAFGWADVMHILATRLPHLKFILPTAPSQPVSINQVRPRPVPFAGAACVPTLHHARSPGCACRAR